VKQIKELQAKEHLTDQILEALCADEDVPEILDRLKNGQTCEGIVEWLGRSPMDDDLEILSPRESQHSTLEAEDHEMGGMGSASFLWTTVTFDTGLLDHLFQLYFSWVHPVHTLFNEDRFADSYRRHSKDYCSPILVNALCAMACHLHLVANEDEINIEQLGVEFSDAVKADIDAEDKTVTTIQAFAVMFLVECMRANALRAASYLKTATSVLTGVEYLEIEGLREVWKDTVRGVRNLNVSVSFSFLCYSN
jgi:hypothetical protein